MSQQKNDSVGEFLAPFQSQGNRSRPYRTLESQGVTEGNAPERKSLAPVVQLPDFLGHSVSEVLGSAEQHLYVARLALSCARAALVQVEGSDEDSRPIRELSLSLEDSINFAFDLMLRVRGQRSSADDLDVPEVTRG